MIPNITALRALISLSETGSITRTAEVLSLTQSAVSHQMKTLQDVLGFAPLVREGRRVRLSHQARQYVAQIAPALEVLENASGASRMHGQLRLNVAPGFAAHWLAPRLKAFTHQHPDLRVHVNSARGYGDLGSRSDDLYISFAERHQVPKTATPLMSVAFFPVATAGLLDDATQEKILEHPLLHLNTTDDWDDWLGQTSPAGGLIFQDMLVMQAAVLAGQGIALGDQMTCAEALACGDLVRVTEEDKPSPRQYWLVEGKADASPAKDAFIQWLTETLDHDRD